MSYETEEHSRSITIRAISFIFMINFINIYSQIDFLWGKKGILSVDYLFDLYKKLDSTNNFSKSFFPSIIPLLNKFLGISGENCLYIISALGAVLSLLIIFEKKFHKSVFMFIVWYCYLNIFLVGQHFTSFSFDHFNLEVGFISIFLCEFYFFDNKYLQCISKYILKFTIFKVLYSFALSLIFSNNKNILSLKAYDSFLLKQLIPSSSIIFLNKFMPNDFHILFSVLIFLVMIIVPFGMFCFFKRICRISGLIIACFCLSLTFVGNFGLSNLMLLAINFVNFDDEFLDLLFRFGEEKKIKVKNGRIINIPNDEELSTAITIDVFCAFVFCLISLFTIFPLYKIIPGQFDLTPNGINNPYKFLNITHLKKIFILIIIYILIMSLYDYYYRHLKTKEEFKYVKSFKDLRNSCKINIVIKTIFFSLLSVIYLSHSIDTFFSGLNIPMITKKKGSILYSSNHKLFNSLHDFAISSGYPIHKGFLEEKSNTGRDVLVFKYLTETIIYEEVNMTNSSLNNNTINNNNETLNNSNNTANNTKIKKPRKKKEWKSMQFKHQINEKGNNNLYFFINILFKQPRLEYALHHLAYENNGMKNLTDKIWIPHLIYKIFNEKKKEENITKIKIDKIRYIFSKYSDDHFRTNFIIPFALIMYTLVFIFSFGKLIALIPDGDLDKNKKEKEIILEENKNDNKVEDNEEKKEDE